MRDTVCAAPRSIYLIKPVGMDGPIKIGCSYLPAKRLRELTRWSPVPLEIIASFPGSLALEANLHSCLAQSRSHKEWFFATDEVRRFVAHIIAGQPVELAINLSDKRRARRRRLDWTPAKRLRMSLSIRYHAARRRGEVIPVSIREIMHAWDKREPSPVEIALLEQRFPFRTARPEKTRSPEPTGADA